MFVWSLQQMSYVVLMYFNTTVGSPSHRGGHSVKNPSFTQISWQALSIHCCNTYTSKSLISADYIESLYVTSQTKIQRIKVRVLCRLLTKSLRPIHCSSKVSEKMRQCPITHELHVFMLMKRHMFEEHCKSFTKKRRYNAPVSMLVKTIAPKHSSPKMPIQILIKSILTFWYHGGVGTALPDMGIMKVHNTVPCDPRLISKQDVSYRVCVYSAFCVKQNTSVARWSGGMRAYTLWMWYGKVTAHGEFSRQREHRYLQQLLFLVHWFRDLLPLFSARELLENCS
jgi:hypothetical protein